MCNAKTENLLFPYDKLGFVSDTDLRLWLMTHVFSQFCQNYPLYLRNKIYNIDVLIFYNSVMYMPLTVLNYV